MYCERCGRKLEEGERCSCRKVEKRQRRRAKAEDRKQKRFNAALLFSAFGLAAGAGMLIYFFAASENFLDRIPIDLVSDYKAYLYYGIPACFLLIGFLSGIAAVRKKVLRKTAVLVLLLNLLGILLCGGLFGQRIYQNYSIEKLCSGTLTEEGAEELYQLYYSTDWDDPIRETIENVLSQKIEEIEKDYIREKISLDQAKDQLHILKMMSFAAVDLSNAEQYLTKAEESKENFHMAESLETNQETLIQAANLYEKVIEEDIYYQEAQNKAKELKKQVEALAREDVTMDNADVLSALYSDADEEVRKLIDTNVQSYIETLKIEVKNGTLGYDSMLQNLDKLNAFSGSQQQVQSSKAYAESMQASALSWEKAVELEQNPDTVFDAVMYYREVLEEDSNYEAAQKRIQDLVAASIENCTVKITEKKVNGEYEAAIKAADEYLLLFPEREELVLLRAECITEYVSFALSEAARLISEEKFDEAERVLSAAYEVTGNADVKIQLDALDTYQPEYLVDLFSADFHDVEVVEWVTDSYGNSHSNALRFDVPYEASAVYQLDGKYRRFKGNLVSSDETSSSAIMNFAIFADDELVFSANQVTKQQAPREIDLDLTGVQKLTIQSMCEDWYGYGYLYLTECILSKSGNPLKEDKKYDRLLDTVVIDSDYTEPLEGLLVDSYGNAHSGYTRFMTDRDAYALYNLNQKYELFTGKIVTESTTDSDAYMSVAIYLDDELVYKKDQMTKMMAEIPFSISTKGARVMKIVTESSDFFWERAKFCITEDKLYFNEADAWQDTSSEAKALTIVEVPMEKEGFSEGIHRYDYVLLDGSWEQAYQACLDRGGHLATFETQEEFEYVSEQLLNNGWKDCLFFIGARRDLAEEDYYWVDDTNCPYGEPLNGSGVWNSWCWFHGEPSLTDANVGTIEHVLNMFYYDDIGQWVWNDVPNELLRAASMYSGSLGYICEYE